MTNHLIYFWLEARGLEISTQNECRKFLQDADKCLRCSTKFFTCRSVSSIEPEQSITSSASWRFSSAGICEEMRSWAWCRVRTRAMRRSICCWGVHHQTIKLSSCLWKPDSKMDAAYTSA